MSPYELPPHSVTYPPLPKIIPKKIIQQRGNANIPYSQVLENPSLESAFLVVATFIYT